MSILDYDNVFYDLENDKKIVEEWIKDNYTITGKLTISDDFVVNCTGGVTVDNKSIDSLTNGLFRWGKVDGFFDCGDCKNLTSLKGAPEEVGGSFWCNHCGRLETLEGAPEKTGFDLNWYGCKKLKITDSDRKKYITYI